MPYRIKLLTSYQVFLILHYIFLGFSSSPYSCLYIFSYFKEYMSFKEGVVLQKSTDMSNSGCLWDKLAVIDMSMLKKRWNYSTLRFYFHCLNMLCSRISWKGNKRHHGQGFYILQLHLFVPLNVAGFLSTFSLKGCSTAGLILLTGYLARSFLSDQIIAQQSKRSSVK